MTWSVRGAAKAAVIIGPVCLSVRWMDLGDGKGPREGRRDSGSLVPTPSTRTVDFDVIAAANVTKGQ